MAKNSTTKVILEANGWTELDQGIYVSRSSATVKRSVGQTTPNGQWKKELQEFKSVKLEKPHKT